VLDRLYVLEGPDEPDLGLNVAYVTASAAIRRLAGAEPWQLPVQTASAIRSAIASIASITDPVQLETQLLTFPAWVIRALDRRTGDYSPYRTGLVSRRAGDGIRPTQLFLAEGNPLRP
jgi:hypothetical protein